MPQFYLDSDNEGYGRMVNLTDIFYIRIPWVNIIHEQSKMYTLPGMTMNSPTLMVGGQILLDQMSLLWWPPPMDGLQALLHQMSPLVACPYGWVTYPTSLDVTASGCSNKINCGMPQTTYGICTPSIQQLFVHKPSNVRLHNNINYKPISRADIAYVRCYQYLA